MKSWITYAALSEKLKYTFWIALNLYISRWHSSYCFKFEYLQVLVPIINKTVTFFLKMHVNIFNLILILEAKQTFYS